MFLPVCVCFHTVSSIWLNLLSSTRSGAYIPPMYFSFAFSSSTVTGYDDLVDDDEDDDDCGADHDVLPRQIASMQIWYTIGPYWRIPIFHLLGGNCLDLQIPSIERYFIKTLTVVKAMSISLVFIDIRLIKVSRFPVFSIGI